MNQTPPFTAFASRTLRLVGILLILTSLLNFVILLVPLNLQDPQWQLNVTIQLVDRGITPLVGLAFLVAGFWIESFLGKPQGDGQRPLSVHSAASLDLRFLAFWLSSVLGVVFLLLIVLLFSTAGAVNEQALTQINQEATQAQAQLATRLTAEVGQQRSKIEGLLKRSSPPECRH
ncbi:HpsJ family protein [Neosynechococcus sphagnicola]|uniref:HpsJ family protein n=1 Tax=Neosynechococcus sphagnicola TaxID=1501145 RepID=UPI00068D20EA|nr:HpsJ family protein [Neosynechococcus sphagnicola]